GNTQRTSTKSSFSASTTACPKSFSSNANSSFPVSGDPPKSGTRTFATPPDKPPRQPFRENPIHRPVAVPIVRQNTFCYLRRRATGDSKKVRFFIGKTTAPRGKNRSFQAFRLLS